MPENPSELISSAEIEALQHQIVEDAEAGRQDAASTGLRTLRMAQLRQRDAAKSLLRIVNQRCLPRETAVQVISEVATSHGENFKMLVWLGDSLESARDIDDLNAPPPNDPVFQTVVDKLASAVERQIEFAEETIVIRALAHAARMLGRQRDEIAERCYRRVVEIDPQSSTNHYNLGLFLKTHGRFEEGMRSNQTAAGLADEAVDSYEWNLGICATGAGQGEVALDVWKRMGVNIEMGRFGLPEGRFGQCKVKLAERPLAERTADTDDPGLEESIWIERLSPCHGIIRSVLYQDLGVDYGDVILMDGAPITEHTYGDRKVSVFPHLATLVRRNFQIFDFAGTQGQPSQLADASIDLDGDAIVYSHSESYRNMCAKCWRDPDLDHERHEPVEMHVVIGRIAAPSHIEPSHLLEQLDGATAKRDPCRLYAPDLCMAAGLESRAAIERRRFALLTEN